MKVAGGEDPVDSVARDASVQGWEPCVRVCGQAAPNTSSNPLSSRAWGQSIISSCCKSVFLDLPFLQSDSSPKLGWDGTWQAGQGAGAPGGQRVVWAMKRRLRTRVAQGLA